MQFGVRSGFVLNQSSAGSLSESLCVEGSGSARPHSRLWHTLSSPGLVLFYTHDGVGCSPHPCEMGMIVITPIYTEKEGRLGEERWCVQDRAAVSGTGSC